MRLRYLSTNTKLALVAAILAAGAIFVWVGIWYAINNQQPQPAAQAVETFTIDVDPIAVVEPSAPLGTPRRTDGVLVDEDVANQQPIAVMIENAAFGGVRPQAGLANAEIVYEVLVEGGITRFMALFSSHEMPDTIGPVRSARQTYLDILAEYDALYAHAGGSPQSLTSIEQLAVKDLNALTSDGRYYYRDTNRVAPHNLYTSDALLTLARRDKGLDDVESTFDAWTVQEDAPNTSTSEDDHFVEIDFGSGPLYEARYEYNAETNAYIRYTGGDIHNDAISEEPIEVKNVVVQIVPPGTITDDEGRVDFDIIGDGDVYIARDGKVIEGRWEKLDTESRTVFIDDDGEYIPLNRGNTWISILPTSGTIDYD